LILHSNDIIFARIVAGLHFDRANFRRIRALCINSMTFSASWPCPAWIRIGQGALLPYRRGHAVVIVDDEKSHIQGLDRTQPGLPLKRSREFTGTLKDADVAISMDGRGRCLDNIFTERLWRSLKYEAADLYKLTDGFRAEQVIGEWIGFYNAERPHSALESQTPAEAYRAGRPVDMTTDKAGAFTASTATTGCDKQDPGIMIR
jgi:hypothetical protein